MTVTLSGNEQRTLSETSVQIKTTLAPAKAVETSILMDYDGANVTGAELKSGVAGQSFIDKDGDIADDKGEKITDNKEIGKVVKFN